MQRPSRHQDNRALKDLLALTGLASVAGLEQNVRTWVTRWVQARKGLFLRADSAGNLLITRSSDRSDASANPTIWFTAHMDHPGFVVLGQVGPRRFELEFRGGVRDAYFPGAPVDILTGDGAAVRARVLSTDPQAEPYRKVTVQTARTDVKIRPGDLGRWAYPGRPSLPYVKG
ncbi:MAG: hypothetical protein U1E27_10395, partial [Kiritimatiellia bacterium]|nr:hypothetical protein [Kiritimatiellia bacterium]